MQYWAFDCEWAPDLKAGRLLYNLPPDLPDEEVMRTMWRASADYDEEKNPQPFLKTIQCKLASIAAVVRNVKDGTNGLGMGDASLHLWSLPALGEPLIGEPRVDDAVADEGEMIGKFFEAYEKRKPTLIGFNSRNADIHIMLQRAFVNGHAAIPGFYREATERPWNVKNIDLMEQLGGKGKGYSVTLNEVALLSGIPGKIDTHGDDVARMFYGGRQREIVEYNMFDAITTYLVWLRMELVRGVFSPDQYRLEQQRMVNLLSTEKEKPNGAYLGKYLAEWKRLSPHLF